MQLTNDLDSLLAGFGAEESLETMMPRGPPRAPAAPAGPPSLPFSSAFTGTARVGDAIRNLAEIPFRFFQGLF
jgi:hypothetical protein